MIESIRTDQLIARAKAAFVATTFDAALADVDEVLRRAPGYADVHNLRGQCLDMLGRGVEAIRAFDTALEINPAYVEAHVNRGLTLRRAGRIDDAQASFANAAAVAEDHQCGGRYPPALSARLANQHADLGDIYTQNGFLMEAAEQYRKGCEIRPTYIDIRNRLARALIDLGILEAAVRELRTVLEVNEFYFDARVNLGLALFRSGAVEDARLQWEQCLLLDGDTTEVEEYLAMIGREAGDVMQITIPGAEGANRQDEWRPAAVAHPLRASA